MDFDYSLKAGDFGFPIQTHLSDGATGTIPDFTDADVIFKMRPVPESDSIAAPISAPAEIVDEATGLCQYVWQEGDTDEPGIYRVEWVVSTPAGPQTFPSEDYNVILIRSDLD